MIAATMWFPLYAVVAVMMVGGIAAWPMYRWHGPAGLHALAAAGIVCLAGALVSFMPIAWAYRRRTAVLPQAALAATGVRLLVTVGLAYGYMSLFGVDKPMLLTWAVVFYLVLLAIETWCVVRIVRGHYGLAASAGDPGALRGRLEGAGGDAGGREVAP